MVMGAAAVSWSTRAFSRKAFELHQLHGESPLQKRIAVELNGMVIQGRIHFSDRAAVVPGDPLRTLVDDLVVIHGETLPLSLGLPNTNAPAKVVHNRAQVLDERSLFGLDHRHQLLVIGLRTAWRARWQGCERSGVATAQLPPQPLNATSRWRLLPEVATCVVEPVTSSASDRIQQIDVPAPPGAPRALEPRQCVVGPHHRHGVPVDQKIGRAPGQAVTPVLAPAKLRHRSFHEAATSVQLEDVNARVGLDEAIAGDAAEMTAV
jgi:hypothetical protein